MRIQHNIMAMNAYRNYNTNTSAVAKNLEIPPTSTASSCWTAPWRTAL